MTIRIKEVKSWLDREAFVRLPLALYKKSPYACPMLLMEQRKFISPKHPFRKSADATMFLAFDGKKPVARALVSYDPQLSAREQKRIAHIGMFECTENEEAAKAVLASCETWAKSTHKVDVIRGPIDYSVNYPLGMYLGPYNSPQCILMNYNPPYYPKLWENFGFEKARDVYSWWGKTPDKIDRWAEKVRRIAGHSSVKIRSLTRKNFKQEMMRIKDFIPYIGNTQSGFVPMNDGEFKKMIQDMILVPPGFVMIAEDGDKIVGISITLPDFNEAMRPLAGKLFPYGLPIGVLKFILGLRKIKTARVALLGVHPDYRFEGIAERMIVETLAFGREKMKFEAAEMGWTMEDNVAMINNIDKVGTEIKKTYRIYEKTMTYS